MLALEKTMSQMSSTEQLTEIPWPRILPASELEPEDEDVMDWSLLVVVSRVEGEQLWEFPTDLSAWRLDCPNQ